MAQSSKKRKFKVGVIGCSAGGIQALSTILPRLPMLPTPYPFPWLIVQHLPPDADDYIAWYLNSLCQIEIKGAEDKEPAQAGVAYLAPANYHLLIEPQGTLALSVDDRVNYSRPSIDVLFESAARSFGPQVIGILLTGANHDGSQGMAEIQRQKGVTIIQDPQDAECPIMPQSALDLIMPDHILSLNAIGRYLQSLRS